jgi:hypothetical protein
LARTINEHIERLAIVPALAILGYPATKDWNAIARDWWNDYPWPQLPAAFDRRAQCFLRALARAYLTDSAVIALANETLARAGFLAEADRFAARVAELMPRKGSAVAAAMRFLGIDRAQFRLVTFDIAARRVRTAPVPAN